MKKLIILLPVLFALVACASQPQPTPDLGDMVSATLTAIAQSATQPGSLQTLSTVTPAPASTAAAQPAGLWKTYQNPAYNFSFEYPALYDEPAYQAACGLKDNNGDIRLGQQIEVSVLDSNGLGLADFTNQLVQSKGWNVASQNSDPVNGLPAVSIQYRFGGTNRFGSLTLVKPAEKVFALGFTAGGFCNVHDEQLSEPNAYAHMVSTFRVSTPAAASPAGLGTITGTLSYPSSFLPPMRVAFFNVATGTAKFIDTQKNQGTFSIDLPAGSYFVVSYPYDASDPNTANLTNPQQGAAGGYTQMVPCGLKAECTDHTLIPVTVIPGQTVTANPGDWYAPISAFPPMPTK